MAKDKGKKEKKKPKKAKLPPAGFTTLEMLLVLIILGVIGYVGYYVYHSRNTTNALNNSSANTQIAVKAPAAKNLIDTKLGDSLRSTISDSVTSGNTAALEGYMASSVNVVIAGSEKSGAESTSKAIMDLDYLTSGTAPWNFDLSATTLATYNKNSSYGKYFDPTKTIVGQSANGYVASFGVNASDKINTVFMSASTDQLQ